MSFDGKMLSLQVFYPDLRNPISTRIEAIVTSGFEFEDIAQYEIRTSGISVVNADWDISGNRISYWIDQAGGRFSVTPGFNGYKLSDDHNQVDPIIGVEILAGPKSLPLAPDAVFFSENAIFIDVDGLAFSPGSTIELIVSFGSADDAGQVVPIHVQDIARLYAAAFGRQPDDPGLSYWIDAYQQGAGIDTISAQFFLSSEFASLFGAPASLTDLELVEILYSNILGRPGEAEGVEFWIAAIESGFARSNLLIAFATSAENVALTGYIDDLARNLSGTEWIVT